VVLCTCGRTSQLSQSNSCVPFCAPMWITLLLLPQQCQWRPSSDRVHAAFLLVTMPAHDGNAICTLQPATFPFHPSELSRPGSSLMLAAHTRAALLYVVSYSFFWGLPSPSCLCIAVVFLSPLSERQCRDTHQEGGQVREKRHPHQKENHVLKGFIMAT
jgi:hypothetical protein